jgi:hypothetical protein
MACWLIISVMCEGLLRTVAVYEDSIRLRDSIVETAGSRDGKGEANSATSKNSVILRHMNSLCVAENSSPTGGSSVSDQLWEPDFLRLK